jgi:hypothetical protein
MPIYVLSICPEMLTRKVAGLCDTEAQSSDGPSSERLLLMSATIRSSQTVNIRTEARRSDLTLPCVAKTSYPGDTNLGDGKALTSLFLGRQRLLIG